MGTFNDPWKIMELLGDFPLMTEGITIPWSKSSQGHPSPISISQAVPVHRLRLRTREAAPHAHRKGVTHLPPDSTGVGERKPTQGVATFHWPF